MPDYKVELIEIYARTPVNAIKCEPRIQALCAEHMADGFFQALWNRVEAMKVQIEMALDGADNPRDAVCGAITLLFNAQDSESDRQLLYDLVLASCRGTWSAAHLEYFEFVWRAHICARRYDFFLSFTSRKPIAPGDNPINTDYRSLIRRTLGDKAYVKSDKSDNNMLADALFTLLAKNGTVKGFRYPHSRFDGHDTVRKLEAACDGSIVFVQLIQPIMFVRPEARENYCFFEWKRFTERMLKEDPARRVVFVVAGVDRKHFSGIFPYLDYKSWHAVVLANDVPYIPQMPDFRLDTFQSIQKLIDRVRDDVEGWQSRLLAAVPA